MKPASFEYVRAASLAEALAALDHDDAKIIAGGQSLVPMMNFRLAQPARLVDINAIAELNRIEDAGTHVEIGALVRHAQAMGCDLLAAHFPVIAEAMAHVAHLAIRNRGSIGGSVAHADPSAEWPLVVALLDGEIVIAGPDGERTAAAEDFFVAPLVTDLAEDEIVVAVRLPRSPPGTGMAFDEMSRRAGDFAIVSAGALVRVEGGVFAQVHLALGGVGDGPVRARAFEAALVGKPATPQAIADCLDLAGDGLEPESDLHASAEYRLHLVRVLAGRVVECALERAMDGER